MQIKNNFTLENRPCYSSGKSLSIPTVSSGISLPGIKKPEKITPQGPRICMNYND